MFSVDPSGHSVLVRLCLILSPLCSLLAAFCSIFGSLNLTTVKLSGVGSSFQKHTDAESKGIKAHFNMDESGVLLLDRVSHALSDQSSGSPENKRSKCAAQRRSQALHQLIALTCRYCHFLPQVESVFETVEEEKEEESTLTSRFCKQRIYLFSFFLCFRTRC